VRAGDSGYEAARIGWNRLYPRYPEAIVFCCDTEDVVNAVKWAGEEGIALRARSGRHNLEGWSCIDGGLVIDVSRMKSVAIDETARTATVGTGLTQKETVPALGHRGFVIPTGSDGGRRPRRCGLRRRLRITHPQFGIGVRQPAGCGGRGGRRLALGEGHRGHRAQQL
jgi:hypothetical protein